MLYPLSYEGLVRRAMVPEPGRASSFGHATGSVLLEEDALAGAVVGCVDHRAEQRRRDDGG